MEYQIETCKRLKLDYTGMIHSEFNPEGWKVENLQNLQPLLMEASAKLFAKREKGELDFSKLLPLMQEEVGQILDYTGEMSANFDNFVLLGIGGSALGPLAVHQALLPYYYNEMESHERNNKPRFYVMDNIDPGRFAEILHRLDLNKTLFNVVSKSGSTSETMAQFMIVCESLKQKIGANYTKHIVITTDRENGNLAPLAQTMGFRRFVIPAGIGGRFSELTPVGLLPAAICGIDVRSLLEGASEMDAWIRSEKNMFFNPAQLRAALSYTAWQNKRNISVFMPYADSLKTFADWYAQLWAESLGKRINIEGLEVNLGQTPVKALGVTDQHSQMQLYIEGPKDKVITFVKLENFDQDLEIPLIDNFPASLDFLAGHSMSELLNAELQATQYALTMAGCQHQTIILPRLDAFSIGQLIMLLEWETAYMGELLNINAFNQPGVEEGKIGTYALMGRQDFDQRRKEIEAYKKSHYIL